MEITKTQRQLAEERASEIQRRLYGEPESGEQLWNIASKYRLTERSVYYIFTQLVGDVILGFYKTSDVAALMQHTFPSLQIHEQTALTKEVETFLLPLQQNTPSAPAVHTIDASEPTAHPEPLHNIRTMSADMNVLRPQAEVVHTASSQADILARPPIAPSNTPVNSPRWDSDV